MPRRPDLTALANWIENSLREAGWAPLLVFGIHVALHLSNIYERFPYLDLPMHFFGGVVMAFFFHRMSINASLLGITRPYQALRHRLFVFTSTCMAAVSWEFSEFIIGWYSAGHTKEGLNDTIGDLFFGIVGCLFFVILASRSRPTSPLSTFDA
jgi:hypothetical protein